MKTTKSQVEVLQMLKDVSKGLGLSFEIESHSETLSVYRISYKTVWVQGAFQFTCISSGNSTSLDMEIVSYVPIKRSYQIVPKMNQGPFNKYYNSTLMPALNKAMGNQTQESSTKSKETATADSKTSEQSGVSDGGFQKSNGSTSNPLPYIFGGIAVVGILLFLVGSNGGGLSKPDPCKCIDYGGMAAVNSSYAPKNTKEWNKCIKAYGNATRMTNECIDKR